MYVFHVIELYIDLQVSFHDQEGILYLDPSTPVNLHNRLFQPISSNEIQNPLMTLLEFWGIFRVLGFYLSLGGGNHEYVLGLGVTRNSQHPVEVGKVFYVRPLLSDLS